MRNLYGTRSIVPNNYSFTFDKIYYEEVPTTQNDGILIGRSVLYHPDKTVYLKTADGYKQIAKLDNTERLIRNEGMVLLPEHNVSSINYLSGDGATYNGDGLYILNYEELKTKTENGGYSQVSDSSVYDANIIYFTKKENETEYIKTICSNNYKTIGKDSIYCNYFGTADDKKYAYPLYTLEDNSFQNISQNNLFYKNEGVEDCGFIPDLTGETFIYLQEYKLMIESDSGTYYLTNSEAEKHKVLDNNIYYSYEKQENVYKKVTDLVVEQDYYINSNSFSLISSAPEGTEIGTKYEQYIYYLYQTTNNGATGIQGYFIYPTEDKNWGKGQDFPYILINNTKSYTDYRDDGMLYFLSKEDENNLDSWPSIRGIPKEDYLKNSVFLLEQRSNRIIEDETNIVTYENQSDLPNNVPNLYCYTNNNGIITKRLISNTAENWHLAKAAAKNKSIGVPGKLSVEMYQILTDITMYTNTKDEVIEGKQDKDTDRKELYHDNKTFIRKGKRVYKYSGDGTEGNNEDTSQVFYKYDPADRHGLIEVPKNSNLSDTSIYIIDKDSSSWGEWEDITEQYTGYIGDLDPNTVGFMSPEESGTQSEYVPAQLPYNKHTQYYIIDNQKEYKSANIDQVTFDNSFKTKDNNGVLSWNDKSSTYYVKANANRGNLNNSNTLVEAANTLDEIIGSRTRLNNIEKEGQVNKIVQGDLSSSLNDDNRPYKIPEKDIMDALVHHDADIGAIEDLSNIEVKDENGDIIVSNNTYNLTFTKQNEQPDNIDSSNNNTVKVRSLTDAIVKTDNIIGHVERIGRDGFVNKQLHSKKKITGTGSGQDERYYNIEEQNLIDTIVHHDADIGCIEKINTLSKQQNHLGTHNLNFVNTGDYTYLDNKNNKISNINSLTEAIVKEDNMMGYIGRLGQLKKNVSETDGTQGVTGTGGAIENPDKRPYSIPETTIIDTLVHHDADIGSIEDLKAGLKTGNNTNNLNFTISDTTADKDGFKQVNDIQSIKDALIILDNLIGARRRLDDEQLKTDDSTLINTPDTDDDVRPVSISETNVIDAIIHHDADIGSIEELSGTNNTYNLTFTTQKEKPINIDSSNNSAVNVRSLTDAIEKEDNMIGYIERLGIGSTVNGKGHTEKGITGTGDTKEDTEDKVVSDSRPYNIPETNIVDTLVHHDADIGAIENIDKNKDNSVNRNLVFTKNTIEDSKHEINSLTDAITILDNIIGNYDGIEKEDNSNLKEKNADLVTAINYLSKFIVGYKSKLNNDETTTNLKTETLVTAINTLDNILGKFKLTANLNASGSSTFIEAIQKLDNILGNFESMKKLNTSDAKTFTEAIQKLDNVLGNFDVTNTNNLKGQQNIIDSIKVLDTKIGAVGETTSLQTQIKEITGNMSDVKNMMQYINNLGLNLDILTHTVNNISNNITLEWGTF